MTAIRDQRTAAGLTRRQVADALKVEVSTVVRWEARNFIPKLRERKAFDRFIRKTTKGEV